ncbi:MAG: acetyl-CoA synthetase [Promethearchaeota archaeon]|nr:MAG: acetyl-CoA synthetase [Candidatus Lokiarchaeota archaeon]
MKSLEIFFDPKSIAIIGASDTPKFGSPTTKYLLNSNFKTYPVHLYKDEILGHKAYKNIKDIPDEIDLAIIMVNNDNVLGAVEDCVEKKVNGIIIESAGFAETKIEKYVKIQNQIESIAKESGIRIIGPNCVGVTNFKNKFTSTEVNFNEEEITEGYVSIIAQSGVLGNVFIDWGSDEKIGFSKSITMGNKVDVDEVDLLEYLENDPDTKVITLYLEGVKRGNKFNEILKNMTKPILIVKNGKSNIGSKAIQSHTGSIAGNDLIYDAIFKQNGSIFRVNDFYEMFNIAKIFSMQPLPTGKNIAIITGSGSLGILACDQIMKNGLNLAQFEEKTHIEMREVAPNWVSLKNPVDLGPSQFITLEPSLKAIFKDKNVNSILFIFTVPKNPLINFGYSIKRPLKLIQKYSTTYEKPLVIACFGSRWVFDYVIERAINYNIPVVSSIKDSITAFKMMYEFKKYIEKKE